MKFSLTILVLLLFGLQTSAQTLEVCIKNIRNTKGQLCVAIFKSEEDFRAEVPFWGMKYCKSEIKDKTGRVLIPVLPGEYGLSVLDDENSDGAMKYNFIGFPLEGFGFSNYKHKGIRKPRFKQFSFDATINQKMLISVEMVYL